MALLALDMGYKARPTGIALLARVVQTLLHRQKRIAHVFPSSNYKAQIIKAKKWRHTPPRQYSKAKGRKFYLVWG